MEELRRIRRDRERGREKGKMEVVRRMRRDRERERGRWRR